MTHGPDKEIINEVTTELRRDLFLTEWYTAINNFCLVQFLA